MLKSTNPLNQIKIAAPCSANWEQMRGSDEARFCNECNLHVYNISMLTRKEALNLIQRTEGKLCVKFYKRYDGTVITSNCPKGLRVLRQRILRLASATLAVLLSVPAWLTDVNASPRIQEQALRQSNEKQRHGKRHKRAKRKGCVMSTMGEIMPTVIPPLPSRTLPTISPVTMPPAVINMPPPPPPPKKEL